MAVVLLFCATGSEGLYFLVLNRSLRTSQFERLGYPKPSQALERMLAGIKVHNGGALLSSLALYGHYPSGVQTAYDGICDDADHYEPTAPSSTDRPLPEHMVNAAEPVGRGVMIRAGSGAGSSVSDESPIHPLERVSTHKKASPPAQDFPHGATVKLGAANSGKRTEDRNTSVIAAPTDAYAGSSTPTTEGTCGPGAEPSPVYTWHPCTRCLPGLPDHPDASPLPPNRHFSDDERGNSTKFPEVKGDGAMRPLLVVMIVPSGGGTESCRVQTRRGCDRAK